MYGFIFKSTQKRAYLILLHLPRAATKNVYMVAFDLCLPADSIILQEFEQLCGLKNTT